MTITNSIQREVRLNRLLVICFAFGASALLASLLAQYGWDLAPCRLCKWQRLLVGMITIFSVMGYGTRWKKVFFHSCQALLGLLAGLAAYHLLVQLGWMADPCAVSCKVDSMETFKNLLNTPIPCSTSPKLLGVPLAGYSLIGTGAVLGTTLLSWKGRIPRSYR